jgi:hypothetical protein
MQPIVEKKGHNGTLRIFEDHVEIDRRGSLAAWLNCLVGVTSIHFKDIVSMNARAQVSVRAHIMSQSKFNIPS